MTCYIAFLRGINVGGHIVTKDILKKAFQSLGYLEVSTYKQSGNVIFKTQVENSWVIKAEIECCLKKILGYDVPIFLRTISRLKFIIELNPFQGQQSEGSSFLVTFTDSMPNIFPLSLPRIIPRSTAEIISYETSEVFSVTHGGGEGALPNPFLEKTLGLKATTRNFNVIKEIVKKFG